MTSKFKKLKAHGGVVIGGALLGLFWGGPIGAVIGGTVGHLTAKKALK